MHDVGVSRLFFYFFFNKTKDVEESMSGLQDRDQLAQITGDNRRLLLDTLEHIVASLSVNAGVLKTLEEEADMMDIERYKEAASCLDALFTAERIPGTTPCLLLTTSTH